MSVSVTNLTKIYGDQHALDGISFEAPAGQILGFLGPNGAGKTTTMKILTCYLSQSSGSASVFGHDVETAAKEGGGHFRGGWDISAIWAGEAGGGPLGPGLVARRRREKILA